MQTDVVHFVVSWTERIQSSKASPDSRRLPSPPGIQALLNAGRFDQGISELRDVLASQGVSYPATARRALLSIIAQRVGAVSLLEG